MIKFAIIIPFRPKVESNDWARESDLLQQTIQSVLRQTYDAVKVFVVYTDLPAHVITDQRVEYVLFPYGYQAFDSIENREVLMEKFKRSTKMVVRRWDKARKLTYGSKLAKEAGFDYIMALDADDLLSSRLFPFLSNDATSNDRKGWYMEKGYLYKTHTNYLVKVPKLMRFLNGSSHVLHASLVTIPDFSSIVWEDYNLFTDHGWIKGRMEHDFGVQLTEIPFPGLVYVVHGSNISQVQKKEFSFSIKGIVKRILRGVILTDTLREEFNINK